MIEKLYLDQFRNFRKKRIDFSPLINVIVGPNASGKTNILESLFLLSTGKSFKARLEEEMVNYSSEMARVIGVLGVEAHDKKLLESESSGEESEKTRLEVILTRGELNIESSFPQKVPRKKLLVNQISRRLIDFAGILKVVLFAPQDLDLVTQSPNLRRRFLDTVLSQVDREYRRSILSYEKGLRQRNRLLLKIREEGLSRSQLLFWDKLLIKNGDYISRAREEFISFVNTIQFEEPLSDFEIEYDKSAISEARLEQYAEEEVMAATTLVGPHRDDFIFKSKSKGGRDIALFGSRGEQRMAVLWLKIAEYSFIETKTKDKPVFLLDDIFSELDHKNRLIVFDFLKGDNSFSLVKVGQSIITTADEHYLEELEKVEKIRL
ncbi:MAG: DNA recombination and repair protein RecF [Candidatus Woesebacteria bacterium]|nr:MAG: DNA recombination and repair protein RecF [Candidatus Woesebacteria bacterium]